MKPTQQEIIKLARDAGIVFDERAMPYYERLVHLALERFGAGGGEPVATVQRLAGRMPSIAYSQKRIEPLAHGTKLYTHPSPTDLRAEYLRALDDAKKVALDADHMGSVNLKLMKNRIGNAIEALKGKQ